MQRLLIFTVLFSFFLYVPPLVSADIGVGVGSGKIVLEEDLKPGTLYQLPSITVINTGTVTGEYTLDVTFHQDQPEIRPDASWFVYKPESFSLEPGQAQVVEISMALPIKTQPGDYFAYLEARPLATVTNQSGAAIGVAAASKLYFSVSPANIFQALWYRALSIWAQYHRYIIFVLTAALILGGIKTAQHFLSFNIQIKQKPEDSEKK